MPKTVTLLFTIDNSDTCRIGVLPTDPNDDYSQRAKEFGILENSSHVFFNPKGQMFVVRDDQLFKGPAPVTPWNEEDWFSLAKCVGNSSWDEYKFLYFKSDGKLFAVTHSGAWYKGREPDHEHVPWNTDVATKIGCSGWQHFDALCFAPNKIMYGVYKGELRQTPPMFKTDGTWFDQSIKIGKSGWDKLSNFMGFSSDGKLWCVSDDGTMYTGDPPTDQDFPWLEKAKKMGTGYHEFKTMAFTEDRTIVKILDLRFLSDLGKIVSMEPKIISEKIYDNRNSTTTLMSTFEVDKVYVAESEFGQEHGLDFSQEADFTVNAGLPFATKSKIHIDMKDPQSQKWSFVKKNSIATHFKMTSMIEVLPGDSALVIAVVKKAMIELPYKAEVLTVFDNKITISGIWKGCSTFDLKIRQISD